MVKLIVMVGLPASGKSTKSKELEKYFDAVIVSTDAIRGELGDESDQSHNDEVFSIAHKRIRESLKSGKNVIYDATNVSRRDRRRVLADTNGIDCEKICYIVWENLDICLARNSIRDRIVPTDVILGMLKRFNTPAYFEGFDKICLSRGLTNSIKVLASNYSHMDQGNHHHTLTLGGHQEKAYELVKEWNDPLLSCAAMIHDCGKPICKFYDENKKEYRYFGHENAGAYLALGCEDGEYDPLELSLLVNLHMEPLHWLHTDCPEQTALKYRKLWGDDTFKRIIKLSAADREAH